MPAAAAAAAAVSRHWATAAMYGLSSIPVTLAPFVCLRNGGRVRAWEEEAVERARGPSE